MPEAVDEVISGSGITCRGFKESSSWTAARRKYRILVEVFNIFFSLYSLEVDDFLIEGAI